MERLFQLLSNTYFRSLARASIDNPYYKQMMSILMEFDKVCYEDCGVSHVRILDFLQRHERVITTFEDLECITKH